MTDDFLRRAKEAEREFEELLEDPAWGRFQKHPKDFPSEGEPATHKEEPTT